MPLTLPQKPDPTLCRPPGYSWGGVVSGPRAQENGGAAPFLLQLEGTQTQECKHAGLACMCNMYIIHGLLSLWPG